MPVHHQDVGGPRLQAALDSGVDLGGDEFSGHLVVAAVGAAVVGVADYTRRPFLIGHHVDAHGHPLRRDA